MRKITLWTFLGIFMFVVVGINVRSSSAFLFIDGGKAGSKIAEFAGKAKEKGEAAIKWVSESKFGKFVGKGIQMGKDAVKFVKAGIKAVNKLKDNILNSPEYRAAKISKEIAELTKETAALTKQRQKNKSDTDMEIAAARERNEAKISALKDNTANLQTMSSTRGGNVDEDYDFAAAQKNNDEAARILQNSTEGDIAGLKSSLDSRNDAIDNQIKTKSNQIINLTKKLADIVNLNVKMKKSKQDPKKDLEKAQKAIYLDPKEPASIKNVKTKKQERFAARQNTLLDVAGQATQAKYETIEASEESKSTTKAVATTPGSSDATAVNTSVAIGYGDQLYEYIALVVADLQRETIVAIADGMDIKSLNPDRDLGSFNIDEYYIPKPSLADLLKDAKNNATGGLDSASALAGKAGGIANDASGAIGTAQGMAGSVSGTVAGVKDAASSAAGSVSNLTGGSGGGNSSTPSPTPDNEEEDENSGTGVML